MLARGSPKVEVVLDGDNKPIKRFGKTVTRVVEKDGKIVYEPYKIKVLNTIDFKKSMHYNPFAYIRSEKDILKLTTALIANTKGEGFKNGEDFWVKAETLLYCALIGYIYYEAPTPEMNMNTLVELINAMDVREDDETYQNAVDIMFEDLEMGDEEKGIPPRPDHFAVRQYKKYKLAAGVVSCRRLLNQI
jgi:type IV secretion system protein VirD4